MNDETLNNRIAVLQQEITANAREIVRLHAVIEKETSEMLTLQAERDRISGLKVRVMDREIQVRVSYQGGRS